MGLVALVVGLPFAGALIGIFAGRRAAPYLAVIPTGAALLISAWLAYAQAAAGPREATLTLVETGSVPISVSLGLDGLSALVGVLVTVVATAVQTYSIGYMRQEPRYASYAAFISLFTSAMLLVVHAADLLVLYVGWEVMGFCSYALIGHFWEDRANSRAAIKAFLVTRLGDVGFLFGIFVLGISAGSFRIGDVLAAVPAMSPGTLVAATLLLVAGVAGKSAQVPLHTWLPDAMAGPTPISALIHAATMVAAGIFIVARLYPAFVAAPPTLDLLAVLAALGMLGAALAALAADDLKRVLAYSTVSQLAYMAAGLAAGTRDGAVFHLLTHGAFKALLFLCAGAVIHAVGSNLMTDMGGLRRGLPVTFPAMTIGFAALMGLPPASGFFSKDVIIAVTEHTAGGEGAPLTIWIAWLVYGVALVTVAVTAAYSTRAWLRTFFGVRRPDLAAHEGPASMVVPIAVLAVPALLLGFAGLPFAGLRPDLPSSLLSVGASLAGAVVVWTAWRRDPESDPARVLGPLRPAAEQAFYVDRAYHALFVRPVAALARLTVRADDRVVDGAVRGSGRTAVGAGGLLRRLQAGNAQAYVTGVLAGVLIITVGVVVLR
ncbi:NADH-quinone oxidoreductase subunit L [Bailinhaonella thermotolerans]|uniref:NADH-quinone oxidoreductase subunit L n=1 Tax=Bailinhaonella thermotolerans TaxID=1070861 RepID=A0A3A4ASP8_9ACTN|nr:NADH-quinone oxidoreductase subunit L [Bailinhaonella thermotolerans]RJL33060.1 NADH-quinone oxidoreductase subunit L [Bailinhaonella thermotolerans]